MIHFGYLEGLEWLVLLLLLWIVDEKVALSQQMKVYRWVRTLNKKSIIHD